MAGSTIWLEREVGALIVRWLDRLPDWTPFSDRDEGAACLTCARYSASLQLSDVPHTLVHQIASPIDDLVTNCFLTVAAERYEPLLAAGWSISVDNGLVRLVAPVHAPPRERHPAPAADVAGLRLALTELHTDLLGRAVYTVQQNQRAIAGAVRATVEPVVWRMAAELIDEVCGP
ncbi:hypothetical protein ACFFGH_23010 [Lysobacter korlensis]|uniref:Uncharacterized protein n=1 Tax=Lysobacter korlensis TaxID=553636 RepID=A0ABV6RWA4_9GAMM